MIATTNRNTVTLSRTVRRKLAACTGGAVKVFVALTQAAGGGPVPNEISYRALAEMAGLNRSTVIRSVRHLLDAGLIALGVRNGAKRGNTYTVLVPDEPTPTQAINDGETVPHERRTNHDGT